MLARAGASSLLSLLAAGLLSVSAGAAPAAKSVTKSEDKVAATLSWQQDSDSFGNPTFSALHLQIQREGKAVYDAAVSSTECEPCGLEEFKGAPAPLQVTELEGNGEPNVLLSLYTGGAHCCSVLQILYYDPASATYLLSQHNFGDPTPRVADVAGDYRKELESADDRFAYEFTAYAYSGLPIQIWRFSKGHLRDATRQFPAAIKADAKAQLRRFRGQRRHGYGLGFIAAWAADEELLGHRTAVNRLLASEARLHNLRSADRLSPGGLGFVQKLKRFLKKTGYS